MLPQWRNFATSGHTVLWLIATCYSFCHRPILYCLLFFGTKRRVESHRSNVEINKSCWARRHLFQKRIVALQSLQRHTNDVTSCCCHRWRQRSLNRHTFDVISCWCLRWCQWLLSTSQLLVAIDVICFCCCFLWLTLRGAVALDDVTGCSCLT